MNSIKVRKAILAKIKALQADLDALDRLNAEYGSSDGRDEPSGETLPFDETKGLSLADVIREVIDTFGDKNFTKGEVIAALKERYPTKAVKLATVASFLAKMGKSGYLLVSEKGAGKTPSKYVRSPV